MALLSYIVANNNDSLPDVNHGDKRPHYSGDKYSSQSRSTSHDRRKAWVDDDRAVTKWANGGLSYVAGKSPSQTAAERYQQSKHDQALAFTITKFSRINQAVLLVSKPKVSNSRPQRRKSTIQEEKHQFHRYGSHDRS